MKNYIAIIFDLFDTIVNFNFNHLPSIELKGFRSRTTSIEVFKVFSKYYPEAVFSEFYDPFIKSYHDFQELKLKEYREFPNRERFKLMLDSMDLKYEQELIDNMVVAHMNALASCVEFPEANHETLLYLKEKKLPFSDSFKL